MLGINLFGSRTLWWWWNSPHERKESWSLPDITSPALGVHNICWKCRRSILFFLQFSSVYLLTLSADDFEESTFKSFYLIYTSSCLLWRSRKEKKATTKNTSL